MATETQLYRYKPLTKASQYTGDNIEILRSYGLNNALTMEIDEDSKSIEIWKDSFNKVNIDVGDYVIYGNKIPKWEFERDYEPVPACGEQGDGWIDFIKSPPSNDILEEYLTVIDGVIYLQHWTYGKWNQYAGVKYYRPLPSPPTSAEA